MLCYFYEPFNAGLALGEHNNVCRSSNQALKMSFLLGAASAATHEEVPYWQALLDRPSLSHLFSALVTSH
ncbi:hypothetical protein B447_14759 [Thauera sp. 27]|nr:hypothetical protein B447_14759 [Thauera sp. 27]